MTNVLGALRSAVSSLGKWLYWEGSADARDADGAPLSDGWIQDQAESLYRRCGFTPSNEPFLLDPDVLYAAGDPKAQVLYLLRRHGLPQADVTIYLHGDLRLGHKTCGGLARYPVVFDTSSLGPKQELLSVEDGSYAILDKSDPGKPLLISRAGDFPISKSKAGIYLNQDYLGFKERLAKTICHEVAHLYLYYNGVHKPTRSFDRTREYQTDIAMFAMGLGAVVLRSKSPGYLSIRQLKIAQARVMELVG